MILQVDIEGSRPQSRHGGKPLTDQAFGFYRIMVLSPVDDGLSSYWMFNGAWHFREPPNLNPPKAWLL
jgi:hypothetical protein